MIAVNVADLTKVQPPLLGLVQNAIPDPWEATTVHAEPGMIDGIAVVMNVPDERAEAILHFVRKRHPKNDVRFYRKREKGETWARI